MPMLLTDPSLPDNPIVFANHAFLRMTGYTPEELIGKNCRFLQGAETDRETVREVGIAVQNEQDIAVEILNYKKDGTTFWNALFISPVRDKDDKVIYFFASQLDVSRRRDAEAALQQAQKMEAVGQLTGGIAHDFNNMLQVINGFTEILERQVAKIGDDRINRSIRMVTEAAGNATALTQQLLAFSRKQKLDGRVVNINDLVHRMDSLLDGSVGGAIALNLELADGLANTRLDPAQLESALMNLAINARDAMPKGGTITILTANRLVSAMDGMALQGLPGGDYVVVSVIDTGTGMSQEVAKRVTEPFFTTKTEGRGSGLGLSMVYGFVKQSGGALHVDSAIGQGTTITLYFPATNQAKRPDPSGSNRSMDRGGTESILIVDDRRDVAEVAEAMLGGAGYKTALVTTPSEALALLRSQSFDMLLSDVVMPEMNGVVLARQARQMKPKVKVLLCTGYASAAIERTDTVGTEFDTINKPFRQTDLLRRVRILLDGHTGVT